jgi:hypothetical protein
MSQSRSHIVVAPKSSTVPFPKLPIPCPCCRAPLSLEIHTWLGGLHFMLADATPAQQPATAAVAPAEEVR